MLLSADFVAVIKINIKILVYMAVRVGEAKILVFCGRRFFVNAQKTSDVNTRRVLARKFSKQ